MNRNLISALLLVLLAACDKMEITDIQADSFMKYINTYPVFYGADIKQTEGSGYVAIGTVQLFNTTTDICLLRTDIYGNLVDSARYYGREMDEKAYCLQLLEDGGLAILGSSVNPASGRKEVYFIRTNNQGDTLWTKKISGPGNLEAYYFETDPGGSYILTGRSERSSTNADNQIWLCSLSDNGSINWQRTFGGDKDDEGMHLQFLSDGKIVITGHTRSYPPGTDNSHAFLLKVSATGGLNAFIAIESDYDEEGNCIRALDDNNFLLVGTVKNTASGNGNDVMLKKLSLTTTLLQIQEDKTYGTAGNDYGKCILIDDNELHLLATTASAGINSSIAIIRTDLTGSNPLYTYFGEGSQLSGSNFVKTSDGGFIITGTNKHSENDISLALIKTKPDTSL